MAKSGSFAALLSGLRAEKPKVPDTPPVMTVQKGASAHPAAVADKKNAAQAASAGVGKRNLPATGEKVSVPAGAPEASRPSVPATQDKVTAAETKEVPDRAKKTGRQGSHDQNREDPAAMAGREAAVAAFSGVGAGSLLQPGKLVPNHRGNHQLLRHNAYNQPGCRGYDQ